MTWYLDTFPPWYANSYILRMKSLAMLNLNRISPNADFCSKITADIKILNSNVLYITHEIDKVHKLLRTLTIDKDLQKSVDEYFDDTETDSSHEMIIPDEK